MQAGVLHEWNVAPREAARIQLELRARLEITDDFGAIRRVAGADVALDEKRRRAVAGVIVYSFPALEELERAWAARPLTFPYVPGLLAFREGPALLKAFEKLRSEPDLLLFDAQGYAHPRRFGLASHLAVVLGKPGIGVAKSVLIGRYREPARAAGSWTPLVEGKETVGAALRTRAGVQPVFISIGHRVSLRSAIDFALRCSDGTRIPKPTREADHFVAELKRKRT